MRNSTFSRKVDWIWKECSRNYCDHLASAWGILQEIESDHLLLTHGRHFTCLSTERKNKQPVSTDLSLLAKSLGGKDGECTRWLFNFSSKQED